ncbi:MAG: asparagine synthase (glutamine-hydrolyzing) [Ignavibacteria bacterium]
MCGICGIVSDKLCNDDNLNKMNFSIIHRGPDDEGIYIQNSFGMAMRRLSIIDIKNGKQPISTNDKRYTVILNGEIYNYRELKEKHLSSFTFKTTTDTEVLLNMYVKFGKSCLEHINGMFAFCIYDNYMEEMFIARDRIGIKPLYYYQYNNDFLFSSEIKSFFTINNIDLSLNLKYLNDFLSFGYIPSPLTIFRNVKKLEPGHFIVKKRNKLTIKQYWGNDYKSFGANNYNYDENKEILKGLISDTVKKEMVSDVPIGSFLSGGLDSSIITYEMCQHSEQIINTFTITFANSRNNDDEKYSRYITKKFGTNHTETKADLNNTPIDEIINKLDEPFAITSLIPLYLNSRTSSKDVKVALSGDGADEILAGYSRYNSVKYLTYLKSIKLLNKEDLNTFRNSIISRFKSRKVKKGIDVFLIQYLKLIEDNTFHNKYLNYTNNTNLMSKFSIFTKNLLSEFGNLIYEDRITELINEKDGKIDGNDMLWFDLKTSLVDEMLSKVDIASMLNSLEVRVPFLNSDIVEYAFTLPFDYKYKKTGKRILKDAYKDILGNELVYAKKRGFNMPIDYWLKNNMKERFLELINSEFLIDLGLNKETLNIEFKKYLNNKSHLSEITFYYIYNLIVWYYNFRLKIN